jgi:hypothetical protein
MMMKCFLRFEADSLDDAEECSSIAQAVRVFEIAARECDRYGQKLEATVHIADSREELAEYPDLLLRLGARGGVVRERC